MKLREARRRLPVVESLPPGRGRRVLPPPRGAVQRPALAVWEFTRACDQRCKACGPRAGVARPDELSTDEALRLVDELAELGVGEVALIGGEAYLRADVLWVIRRIRERGMSCSMTTGGLGLTQTRADALVEAGLQLVSVSIDGLEASHDALRGTPGGWRRCFEALAHSRKAGARIAANTQINRLSWRELLPLCDLLADAGVEVWQMFLTMPHGNAADHPELLLQPFELLELFPALDRVIARCAARRMRFWPGNNLGYFGPLEGKLRRLQQEDGHYKGCSAGRTGLGIEADGTIKSCPSLGGAVNAGGNWRDHGLRALWERAPEIRYVEDRGVDSLWGYCRDCYYAETCMGGCTAMSEPLLGRPGNNPYCHHRALEMDRMGLRERVEQVAGADDEAFAHGLFQIVREPKVAGALPVTIEGPRTGREVAFFGAGTPLERAGETLS
ncbi:radical SAM protein [Nannocystis sp. RBIL2]|uniref:radical SAM/SPASM domain-containing protein n=1 Tax=Nannocystis sp. RBIL2 TaxID=2996788 RepID=UPI00227034D8|nr:radical SAM protein [Nannocystis sp. RBIL2]